MLRSIAVPRQHRLHCPTARPSFRSCPSRLQQVHRYGSESGLENELRSTIDHFRHITLPKSMIYTSHEELIQKLKGLGFLQSNAVEEAFARINRIHFVNRGVTLNAPFMHAMCLELLRTRLQQGNRALDVGAGSGYLSACMAHMVGPDGDVFGIDSDWNVVESATRNMMNFKVTKHYLQHGLLTLKVGDGREGLPTKAPFDAIHVGVAVEAIPPALVKQLRPGGMMVLPLINDINNKKSLQTLTVIVRKPATANSESRDMPEFDTFPVLQVNYSLMSRSPNAGQQNSKS